MADDFSQANRRLRIATPLGPDALLITALTGTEGISTLFHFEAELLGRDEKADFAAIVGKPVTIAIAAGDGARHLHGIVSRFRQGGTAGRHATYRAEIVPWMWFLTRTTDCRIFQKKSVPDIVTQIFKDHGFSDYRLQVTGSFEPREYCVQYRETDYAFVARLLEEEGIFYFFQHEDGKHTLVIANDARTHQPCPVLDRVRFVHAQESLNDDDVVTEFSKEQEVRTGKVTLTDYNFETPSLDLIASATGNDSNHFEQYDYPAGAANRGRTEALARVRQQEEDATRVLCRGNGHARSFTTGYKFTMRAAGDGIPATFDGSYVLTRVQHQASESYAGGEESEVSYRNQFECIESAVPFRPASRTERPAIHGVQTAVVVGPAGEEIFVDKYGRVKVQFFWDREGKRNENSSCWLRVSTAWAGKHWGMVSIPRIGQEVIVSFLEGDPDQPIVVGSVYNAEQMPPYDLPANKTQSGIKSRSSLGGSPANFNEIRLEDRSGNEHLYIHAEKNQDIVVEHDKTESVGHNETISIAADRSETVGGNETLSVSNNRSRTVSKNEVVTVALTRTHTVGVNEAITVGGAQEITVGAAQAITVGAAQAITVGLTQSVSIGRQQTVDVGANRNLSVGGSMTETVSKNCTLETGKTLLIDAGEAITIKTGDASISMKKNGDITIEGKKISIKGSGDVVIKGSKIVQN